MVLLWSDGDHFRTHARRMERLGDIRWKTTSYRADGGRVRTESGRFDLREADDVDARLWCGDLNWGCVLGIASAWSGMFASCGACVADPTKLTCLACISSVMGVGATHVQCDWCND